MNTPPFSIQLAGFDLSEPVTAASDLLLSLFCFFIVISLQKSKNRNRAVSFWQIFFLGMGISTFTGIVVHGFRNYQTEAAHHSTWMFMNVISGASIYFAQMATASGILKASVFRRSFILIANVQAIAYLASMILISSFSFNAVIIQIAAGMVPVMVIHFVASSRNKPGSLWIGTGISLSFISAVSRTLQLSLNKDWFNYNDVSHIFIAASFFFMYRGIFLGLVHQRNASGNKMSV